MGQLIFFRGLQGLGAGGLITLVLAIIGDVVSPRERGRCTRGGDCKLNLESCDALCDPLHFFRNEDAHALHLRLPGGIMLEKLLGETNGT